MKKQNVSERADDVHPAPPFDSATYEHVRQRIVTKKRDHQKAYFEKIAGEVLSVMRREPDRIFESSDLQIIVENIGFSYTSVGPMTTYMVQEALIERVGRGKYRYGRTMDVGGAGSPALCVTLAGIATISLWETFFEGMVQHSGDREKTIGEFASTMVPEEYAEIVSVLLSLGDDVVEAIYHLIAGATEWQLKASKH